MADVEPRTVNTQVIEALTPPGLRYALFLLFLAGGIGLWLISWFYQIMMGMGVAGLNIPVGWGLYIASFVFWVGIAHSGTLISAVLFLVRAKWRSSISRASEAMTVFAVMTAGMFPLIHLGRVWVFHFILPYPSQRQLWPNFQSPLVLDVVAVTTYLTVSSIFFFVGLIPDIAAVRDRFKVNGLTDTLRYKIYRALSLGWSGAESQWRHYGRAYLFFATLATPLVVSVHSVVSWDFALGILPGWHATIFPPYFVAGAIHSGLAMVLTLMIPLRRILHLEDLLQNKHLEAMAKTIIVTGLIVGYAYIIEPWLAWYSGDKFESQFAWWRATSNMSPLYWLLFPLNVFFPLLFAFKRVRRNLAALFLISILINVGMWLERYVIVTFSTAHDFLPHNWGYYQPTWVEVCIAIGTACFFMFLFSIFAKTLPVVPMADVKEDLMLGPLEDELEELADVRFQRIKTQKSPAFDSVGLKATFDSPRSLIAAVQALVESGVKPHEVFSPVRLEELRHILGFRPSPIRYFTFVGAVLGIIGGFTLAVWSADVNKLIVGGKPPHAWIVYCVVAFEGAVLIGSLVNLLALIFFARLYRSREVHAGYDESFSVDRFGILLNEPREESQQIKTLLLETGATDVQQCTI